MSLENIDHFVVFMLENRTFDSMLGWLYEHDAPALNIPPAAPDDRFRGLQNVNLDTFTNTSGSLSARPTRGAQGFTIPTVAPGEEFSHVNTQFYGTAAPAPGASVTMKGVLADFVEVLQEQGYKEPDVARLAQACMECFTPGQLPVLSQLARHYAVCDDWFASVPSQTNPNRAFLMCGTSNGMVNNGDLETDPRAKIIEDIVKVKIGDDRVDAPTIFNALSDAGTDWTVFWETSYLPQKISELCTLLPSLSILLPVLRPVPELAPLVAVLTALQQLNPYIDYLKELASGDLTSCYTWRVFPHIQRIPDAAKHFQRLDDFHRRARNGELPRFSYIEPFWTISRTTTDNAFTELLSALGNDYHPPGSVLVGEELVKDVYTSLISNEAAWRKTLLLITFDEFVGSFDHVTDPLRPGVVTPPWGPNGQPPFNSGFKFDRLGARVPTILVSPYVQKGTVFRSTSSVPYDHTSVIATTLKWLGESNRLAGFGARASAAPTFEDVLTLKEARTDEGTLAFLDAPRQLGDLVHYGDSLVLKNQNGTYLSTSERAMKVGFAHVVPEETMGLCVDLGLAAYFPTLGGNRQAVLAFVTQSPDPAGDIGDGTPVMIVSREPEVGTQNTLGAWRDSHDCYYFTEYIAGDHSEQEKWIIQKVTRPGGAGYDPRLHYGDQVYLVSPFWEGQRLTRDGDSRWLTTVGEGDYWTVEPVGAAAGPSQKVELFAQGASIGWLGQGSGEWCVVTSKDAAVSLEPSVRKGQLYYRNAADTDRYLSVSDGHHYVGFYNWNWGARPWTLNGDVLTSLYTNAQLSYWSSEDGYVYANGGSGYTPLTVKFH